MPSSFEPCWCPRSCTSSAKPIGGCPSGSTGPFPTSPWKRTKSPWPFSISAGLTFAVIQEIAESLQHRDGRGNHLVFGDVEFAQRAAQRFGASGAQFGEQGAALAAQLQIAGAAVFGVRHPRDQFSFFETVNDPAHRGGRRALHLSQRSQAQRTQLLDPRERRRLRRGDVVDRR